MTKRKKTSAEIHAAREDFFRPSRRLGHDHNALAMHLFARGAFAIAEAELRRAVWLNPYDADFQANLAWCLFKQDKVAEARHWAVEAVALNGGDDMRRLLTPILEANGSAASNEAPETTE